MRKRKYYTYIQYLLNSDKTKYYYILADKRGTLFYLIDGDENLYNTGENIKLGELKGFRFNREIRNELLLKDCPHTI